MPKKTKCPVREGVEYTFRYPRHNFHGILSQLEPRRIVVTAIRDLTREPIESVTFDLQPLLKRSRWLVTGLDVDRNAERSFYVDEMRGIELSGAAG